MHANCKVKNAIIGGQLFGNIIAENKIELQSGSHVEGDIKTKRLVIDEGVFFEGNCSMGAGQARPEGRDRPTPPPPPPRRRHRRLPWVPNRPNSRRSSVTHGASARRRSDRRGLREVGIYTTIPMLLLAGPALGYWLGLQAQSRWGHDPWFAVGGAIFGLAASIRQIVKVIRRGSEET